MKNSGMLSRAAFSISGLRKAWVRERSFRTQIIFSISVLAVFAWVQPELVWWLITLLVLANASAMELINAAIEALADQLHPEAHPEIGAAKDIASAAAFVLNCCSGLFVLLIITKYAE